MKKSISVITAIIIAILCLPYAGAQADFEYMEYPPQAVTEFSPDKLSRISDSADYYGNKGCDETGLYNSPCWEISVNGKKIPVYAAAAYDSGLGTGVLHSFAYIFIPESTQLTVNALYKNGKIENAVLIEGFQKTTPESTGSSVSFNICGEKKYTLLINDDSQDSALTVFTEKLTDEDAETAKLREEYGENNVTVFEKGFYEEESINISTDVVYFKRGVYFKAKHIAEINSDEDAERNTLSPFINISGKSGMLITGHGTFDFTALDRKERNPLFINECQNSTFENMLFINPPIWTVTVYAGKNCELKNIDIIGYRINSDGINICGSESTRVCGCFCRSGDDSFTVKTTNDVYECKNITFENCVGWSGKARNFGVIGETEKDISGITFRNCTSLTRNAVWDNSRIFSIGIISETGTAKISDVLFENIYIHNDYGRAINCSVYSPEISGCEIKNVVFRNITCNSREKAIFSSEPDLSFCGKLCSGISKVIKEKGLERCPLFSLILSLTDKHFNTSNRIEAELENVTVNGISSKEKSFRKQYIAEGNVSVKVK